MGDDDIKAVAWMAMRFGLPAQATTDEPTAIRWRKAGGDVRPLAELDALRAESQRLREALGDAIELLEGWIAWKCPVKHKDEHYAHLERLRLALRAESATVGEAPC